MQVMSVRALSPFVMCAYYAFSRQLYASASSLTTRRKHLGKAHLPEYLALIQARGLPNKLPNALRQQREEQRARDSARTMFSAKSFEDQLVTVIVANDLVCSKPAEESYAKSCSVY
jgi:hypothetical protein